MKIHNKIAILFYLIIGAKVLAAESSLEVEYIGSIEDQLNAPTSLFIDDQSLAVLEPFSKQIKSYSAGGRLTGKINIEGNALGLAKLSEYQYIFCDQSAHKIMSINMITGLSSVYQVPSISFNNPIDIKKYGELMHVLDAGSETIISLDLSTNTVNTIPIIDDKGSLISFASSFDFCPSNHCFYVLDQITCQIWRIDSEGNFINRFGSFGNKPGQLSRGGNVYSDSNGLIYVSDRYQGQIIIFDTSGAYIDDIELTQFVNSRLMIPTGLAMDQDNILYVASTESSAIHLFRVSRLTETQSYFMELISPEEGELVDPFDLILTAQLSVKGDSHLISGIDFEVYLAEKLSEPIRQIVNNKISDLSDVDAGIIISEWQVGTNLANDTEYFWRARARLSDSSLSWTEMRSFRTAKILPENYDLKQNYPNPFNPATRIEFALPENAQVKISVYNVLGQEVKVLLDEPLEAGTHNVIWNGTDKSGLEAATGVYFYKLSTEKFSRSRKMLLIK